MTKVQEKSRIAACKRILKNTKNRTSSNTEFLKYANTIDGIQYVCDGYRIAALKTPLPLEEKPDNIGVIYDFESYLRENIGYAVTLNIPDKTALKAYINEEKQKARGMIHKFIPKYNFGKNLPMVNADYLLDMMNIFPDGTFYANGQYNVFVEDSEGNRGILLGLRKKNANAEATKL